MAEEAAAEGDALAPEIVSGENNADDELSVVVENNSNDGNGHDNPDDAGGGDASSAAPPGPAAVVAPDAAAGGSASSSSVAAAAQLPEARRPPALARELSDCLASLRTALRRQRGVNGSGSAAGGGGRGASSTILNLLSDGAGLVAAAGSAGGGGRNRHFLGFESSPSAGSDGAAGSGGGENTAAMSSSQAALYLYAVAQNIVPLEAAVLGSRPPPMMYAAAGGAAGVLDGGGMMGASNAGGGAKQASEIISSVSVAATFCNSRSIITKSGILPALAHLIESTGTIALPPSAYRKSKGGCRRGPGVLYTLTPFHPEFLQCCLLAGQYRYAQSFLANRPASHTSLSFPYLPLDPTQYLRANYYAGLVHIGCEEWNAALDSFHLCLTVPCSSVSAISVAARKKDLLVRCLVLESEELDGSGGNAASSSAARSDSQARIGGGSGGRPPRSALENKVLELPGAASAALIKYMTASSNRVGGTGGGGGGMSSGGGSAPERTAGSETSEQLPGRERSRRRMRSANSGSSTDAASSGERGAAMPEGPSRTKNYSHLGSYHDLVSTYISGNARNTAKLLAEMKDLLRADGNWGLAMRLEGRQVYRAVRGAASVYSVAGLDVLEKKMREDASPVGDAVGRRGMEDLLMGMAASDAKDPFLADPLAARMDHLTGTVSFIDVHDDGDESSDEEDSLERQSEYDLSRRLESCISLAQRVRDLDVALTTSPRYQQHAARQMMMRSDGRAAAAMQQQQGGSSVADIGHGPMDIGADW